MKIKDIFRSRNSGSGGHNAWLLATVIVLAGLVIFLNRPIKDNIPWFTDFDQARATAEAQNKPILLYFTASWCPPCRQMGRSTWPNERIERIVTHSYVPVKVDLSNESQDTPHHLSVQYDAFALPTIILADRYGKPVEFLQGPISANKLVLLLEKVLHATRNAQSKVPLATFQTRLGPGMR